MPRANSRSSRPSTAAAPAISRRRVTASLAILAALIFSKYFYLAGLTSYYTFYLISKFHVSVRTAQLDLFVFLSAVAVVPGHAELALQILRETPGCRGIFEARL